MRLAIVATAFALIIWACAGAPVPAEMMPPPRPDPEIPVLEQAMQDRLGLQQAQAEGRLPENWRRRELRQAVLDAARRLEAAPCDAAAREELRRAILALLALLMATADKPVETLALDGRIIDASSFLNAPAATVMREAAVAGVISPAEMPEPIRSSAQGPSFRAARFACSSG